MNKAVDIAKVDRNLAVKTSSLEGMDVYSVDNVNMSLSGFYWRKPGEAFRRLPLDMEPVSPGVDSLSWSTAGGHLRFRSDTDCIKIHAAVKDGRMSHMALVGSRGFDLYVGQKFTQVFAKSSVMADKDDEYTVVLYQSPNRIMRDFTIYFPLYSSVEFVEIGLTAGAALEAPTPWPDDRPVAVYGTSITQGGCASRPGGSWTNILSRWHNCEFYNFGFSGSGRGEAAAAEILASIPDPRCYILDYEPNAHNAGTRATLETFLDILRSKHPDVPITVISKTPHRNMLSFGADDDTDVIYEDSFLSRTFQREVVARRRAAGDTNLYFVNGIKLLGDDWDECMMDGCHFNDLGFYRMAENLNKYLKF